MFRLVGASDETNHHLSCKLTTIPCMFALHDAHWAEINDHTQTYLVCTLHVPTFHIESPPPPPNASSSYVWVQKD